MDEQGTVDAGIFNKTQSVGVSQRVKQYLERAWLGHVSDHDPSSDWPVELLQHCGLLLCPCLKIGDPPFKRDMRQHFLSDHEPCKAFFSKSSGSRIFEYISTFHQQMCKDDDKNSSVHTLGKAKQIFFL